MVFAITLVSSRVMVIRIKSLRQKLWPPPSSELGSSVISKQRVGGQAPIPPAKCIISRDQWAGPGKDNALTGRVKTVGEFQNKSSSRVKKGKGGHGNVSAGRWPETEVNRRVGQLQCSSNCHRSHILTSDTVRTPTQPLPPIQQHSVSGKGSYLSPTAS